VLAHDWRTDARHGLTGSWERRNARRPPGANPGYVWLTVSSTCIMRPRTNLFLASTITVEHGFHTTQRLNRICN
jgi:hypothetical protein